FSQCRFSSVQKLVVRAPDESTFDLDLSTFLGPSLTDINLKLNLNRQGPCIKNFLPILFSNVTHLYLTITSGAAAKLFPHLQNLTSLALVIRDHGDILESVARLNNLNNLHIEYGLDTDLTVALLAPLRHMNLTRFVLRQDNRFTLDGSAIPLSALPNLFGSHATMERLEFAWQGSLYFDDNTQDVLWALGQVYSKVNWCSLTAASLPSNLRPSNAYQAYPPMWPSLRRLDLWEMIEPDYADNYANYCTHFANQIILHLPNVSKITVAHKKPFCSRIRRECSSLGKII
ncbi:hypothetical protein D6D18_10402, partial [Aureobasidium pullulans]